jgi:integrase
MKGSTYKRCRCRRDGRDLGNACPQLRRADGSWNPNHGSWFYRVELEPDADGRRRTLRRGGFSSQKAALAALDEARGKVVRGVDPARKVTVREYLREWLDGKRDLRVTTRRSYDQHIGDLWAPALGRLDVGAVRRGHIEAAPDGLDCSAATKVRYLATLKSALHDALREGLVTVNPAALARVESGKRPKVRPLEPEELGRLLDHLGTDPLGAFYETVASTGLRRGEALALRSDDVDLGRGRLVVRQQLVQIGGRHACPYCAHAHKGMLFAKPKTVSGESRTVELDGQTTGLLLEHRLRQDTQRGAWGDAYSDHGLVFAREDGTPLYGHEVTKRFGELCDAAGVRRVRLHDLRHGRASLLLAAGRTSPS